MKRFFGSLPIANMNTCGRAQSGLGGDITYLKVADLPLSGSGDGPMFTPHRGWAFGRQKNVVLTLRALNHAVGNRRPPPGLIFHTDRGIEYAANAFRERLAQLSITQA